MIRSCIIPRIVHLLRVYPPEETETLRQDFHSAIMSSTSNTFEIPEEKLISDQLELPLRLGGAGLLNTSKDMAESMYSSAWIQCLPHITKFLNSNAGIDRDRCLGILQSLGELDKTQNYFENMRRRLLENHDQEQSNTTEASRKEMHIPERWYEFSWPILRKPKQEQPHNDDTSQDTDKETQEDDEQQSPQLYPGNPDKVQALFTSQIHIRNSFDLKKNQFMRHRLQDHEGSEAAAPFVVIHGLEDINVPDDAFKAICKTRFENFTLDNSSTCANIAQKGNTGRCGAALGNHIADHAQTCKVGGWHIKIHNCVRDHIERTLRFMGQQVTKEYQVEKRDGSGKIEADIVIFRADRSTVAIEVKSQSVKNFQEAEDHYGREATAKARLIAALTQYGYKKDEAEAIIQSNSRPETVIPVLLTSNGQIHDLSKKWLRALLVELCPSPIKKGKVRDPLWNPNRFLRRISLSATILSAGRILSALGHPSNVRAWHRF